MANITADRSVLIARRVLERGDLLIEVSERLFQLLAIPWILCLFDVAQYAGARELQCLQFPLALNLSRCLPVSLLLGFSDRFRRVYLRLDRLTFPAASHDSSIGRQN